MKECEVFIVFVPLVRFFLFPSYYSPAFLRSRLTFFDCLSLLLFFRAVGRSTHISDSVGGSATRGSRNRVNWEKNNEIELDIRHS